MKYKNFEELIDAYNQAYVEGEYQEGLNIIKQGLKELPKEEIEKNIYSINLFKAAFKGKLGLLDESMDILENMIDEGYVCTLQWGGICDTFIGNERFMKIREKNTSLRNRVGEEIEFKYEVLLPKDYSSDKKYPLCIGLHGDGENLEFHKKYCPAEKLLEEGFIVVYMQSTQILGHDSYGWMKEDFYNPDKKTWPEPEKIMKISESSYLIWKMYDSAPEQIKSCYDSIKEEYSIDENRVVVSGFSGGAVASVEIAISDYIPVRGFVSICAGKPIAFTKETVKKAMNRGMKCVLMDGEQDIPVKQVDEMMKTFDEIGVKYKYYINEGIGHWYPDDIEDKLLDSIKFIFE